MSLGLQITTTGFILAIFAMLAVMLLSKNDPPDGVKIAVVTAFAFGVLSIPAGIIVAIWA